MTFVCQFCFLKGKVAKQRRKLPSQEEQVLFRWFGCCVLLQLMGASQLCCSTGNQYSKALFSFLRSKKDAEKTTEGLYASTHLQQLTLCCCEMQLMRSLQRMSHGNTQHCSQVSNPILHHLCLE